MDPISLGIGGAVSLAGMAYSAIKGGQAMKRNTALLDKQEAENEAWYNNNRNYFDSTQGKSALEQVRSAYEDRRKTDANTATITGATPEAEIAMKEAQNKGYSDAIRQIATQGAEYTARNEGIYRNQMNNIYNQRINQNNQMAQSAANASSNIGGMFGDLAMGGVFDKGAFASAPPKL